MAALKKLDVILINQKKIRRAPWNNLGRLYRVDFTGYPSTHFSGCRLNGEWYNRGKQNSLGLNWKKNLISPFLFRDFEVLCIRVFNQLYVSVLVMSNLEFQIVNLQPTCLDHCAKMSVLMVAKGVVPFHMKHFKHPIFSLSVKTEVDKRTQ